MRRFGGRTQWSPYAGCSWRRKPSRCALRHSTSSADELTHAQRVLEGGMTWLGLKTLAYVPLTRSNIPSDVPPPDWADQIMQRVYDDIDSKKTLVDRSLLHPHSFFRIGGSSRRRAAAANDRWNGSGWNRRSARCTRSDVGQSIARPRVRRRGDCDAWRTGRRFDKRLLVAIFYVRQSGSLGGRDRSSDELVQSSRPFRFH